jgi:hypothetical protein
VPNQLRGYYGAGYLHFITTSCYRRMPLLARPQCRWSSYRHYADGERGIVLVNEVRKAELKVCKVA